MNTLRQLEIENMKATVPDFGVGDTVDVHYLIKEGDKYVVLTDIQGAEDHLGDMDFKVAGTTQGITALQMDIKIKGITPEIMRQALTQAHTARLSILDKMLEVIPVPRAEMRSFVPRITTIRVPVDKIGAIIGPGGKMIRALQEETNTKIDIDDDGTVYIAATDGIGEAAARERIESLTESALVGHIYTGKVVRVADFGAFVQILPGIDGMVHISQLDTERVEKVEDVVNMGDELTVMVTAIDDNGKIRLSRQAVLEGWTPEEALEHDKGGKSGGGRPRSGSGGDRRGSDRRGSDRGGVSWGAGSESAGGLGMVPRLSAPCAQADADEGDDSGGRQGNSSASDHAHHSQADDPDPAEAGDGVSARAAAPARLRRDHGQRLSSGGGDRELLPRRPAFRRADRL